MNGQFEEVTEPPADVISRTRRKTTLDLLDEAKKENQSLQDQLNQLRVELEALRLERKRPAVNDDDNAAQAPVVKTPRRSRSQTSRHHSQPTPK